MTIPTIGRIVHYTLSATDVSTMAARRGTSAGSLHGNSLAEGDVYPMMIVRVWSPGNPTAAVNGQVYLDGDDILWVTSVCVGTGVRTFAWPVREAPRVPGMERIASTEG